MKSHFFEHFLKLLYSKKKLTSNILNIFSIIVFLGKVKFRLKIEKEIFHQKINKNFN
jgi:hypothetical protein